MWDGVRRSLVSFLLEVNYAMPARIDWYYHRGG